MSLKKSIAEKKLKYGLHSSRIIMGIYSLFRTVFKSFYYVLRYFANILLFLLRFVRFIVRQIVFPWLAVDNLRKSFQYIVRYGFSGFFTKCKRKIIFGSANTQSGNLTMCAILSLIVKKFFSPQAISRNFKLSISYIKNYGFKAFVLKCKQRLCLDALNRNKICESWVERNEPKEADLKKQREMKFSRQPLISIITPVFNTPKKALIDMIESVINQTYSNWELCIADDHSTEEEIKHILRDYMSRDDRIFVDILPKNSGISAASNIALKRASGEFVALLDHGDEITPDALFWFVKEINENPDADFLYSDECKIDDSPEKNRFHFFFKPDWSPELLLNCMYIGHLTIYKKELVNRAGGFRSQYDFSQDYDLALRCSEIAINIRHIHRVLYYWRASINSVAGGGKEFARASNIAALQDAMIRRNIRAKVIQMNHANRVKISFCPKKVSIIIPSDSVINISRCLNVLLLNTSYLDLEIIVVTNSHIINKLLNKFLKVSIIHWVPYDKPYNFSDKCNVGASSATGGILIFYNDDVFPLSDNWVNDLIEYLFIDGVGATSPKLLYENNTIQYGGMITGVPGFVGTAYHKWKDNQIDNFLSMHNFVRNVSVLSGACMSIRKELFEKIGGFDSINTPIAHSDVDFSFRLREAGYRCVYTPYALLRHIGENSWRIKDKKCKADIYCLKRWGEYLIQDPYFTESMKTYLYSDLTNDYKIYADKKIVNKHKKYTGPDILFLVHELSFTGAPLAVLYSAISVVKNGGFAVVVSLSDGPLVENFLEAGIPIIVDERANSDHFLSLDFVSNFDLIVVNTAVLQPAVKALSQILNLPIVWWIHEAKYLKNYFEAQAVSPQDVSFLMSKVAAVICSSYYAKTFVVKYFSRPVVLSYGIPDTPTVYLKSSGSKDNAKFVFVTIGGLEPRKGQDILVQAVSLLNHNILDKCEFRIIGRIYDEKFYKIVKREAENIPQIKFFPQSFPHERVLEMISESDVLICPSRDESFSIVFEEALMNGIPVIASDQVGAIGVVSQGKSCLVFDSESPLSLAEKITLMVKNPEIIKAMGEVARFDYESQFTTSIFEKRFIGILNGILRKYGSNLFLGNKKLTT
jgi:GT2 family glycosyltransferase